MDPGMILTYFSWWFNMILIFIYSIWSWFWVITWSCCFWAITMRSWMGYNMRSDVWIFLQVVWVIPTDISHCWQSCLTGAGCTCLPLQQTIAGKYAFKWGRRALLPALLSRDQLRRVSMLSSSGRILILEQSKGNCDNKQTAPARVMESLLPPFPQLPFWRNGNSM